LPFAYVLHKKRREFAYVLYEKYHVFAYVLHKKRKIFAYVLEKSYLCSILFITKEVAEELMYRIL